RYEPSRHATGDRRPVPTPLRSDRTRDRTVERPPTATTAGGTSTFTADFNPSPVTRRAHRCDDRINRTAAATRSIRHDDHRRPASTWAGTEALVDGVEGVAEGAGPRAAGSFVSTTAPAQS